MTLPSDQKAFDHDAALRSCALGDRQALKSIYLHDSRRLLGIALRIVRQRQLAEDVVHDAFVNIWNKAATFDASRGAGRGWIYSVVRHQALNTLRQREHDVYVDAEAVESFLEKNGEAVGAREVGELFELNASMGRLHGCLAQLDGAKRNSVLLAYVDGYSHGEIARRLSAPLGSVKAWVKRGLAALQECMA